MTEENVDFENMKKYELAEYTRNLTLGKICDDLGIDVIFTFQYICEKSASIKLRSLMSGFPSTKEIIEQKIESFDGLGDNEQ